MPSSVNLTIAVLLACFALSLVAFLSAALIKGLAARARRRKNPALPGETAAALPPPLPQGKVLVWPYVPLDWLWMGFIVLIFAAMSLSNASMADNQAPIKVSAEGLLQSIGLQLFLATMTLLVVVWRLKPVAWLGLRWRGWPWLLLIGPGGVVAMFGLSTLLILTGYPRLMQWLGVESTQESVKLLQQHQDPAILGLMALAAMVVAPLCEELIFRGYLYPAAKRFAGPWVAGLASALIFAAAHGALAPLLPLFVFGVLLTLAYELTGSLWAPIAMHFCFNASTVIIQFAVRISGYQLPDSL